MIYKVTTLGSDNISERASHLDERIGWVVAIVGIPSAFLLHGYVGFIFGSVKANPWRSSPPMPVVFIFSAMVSGIAALSIPQVIIQMLFGALVRIGILGLTQVLPLAASLRKKMYGVAGRLPLAGVFAMRWNLVIGGQLFSKCLPGYATYNLHLGSRESLGTAIAPALRPLGILFVPTKLLPPWPQDETG